MSDEDENMPVVMMDDEGRLPPPPPPAVVENDDVVHAPDEPEAVLIPEWEGEIPALLCRNSAEKTPCSLTYARYVSMVHAHGASAIEFIPV